MLSKLLLALSLVLLGSIASPAMAQSVPGKIVINWTNPTLGDCDAPATCTNVPLTGTYVLTKTQVFVSTSAIPDNSAMLPTVEQVPPAITGTVNMTVTNGSTLFARVKACNANGCSAFSAQTSQVVVVSVKPGVPTSVTITLTITP